MWNYPKLDLSCWLRRYRKTIRRLLRLEQRAEQHGPTRLRKITLLQRLAKLQRRFQTLRFGMRASLLGSLAVGAMVLLPQSGLAQTPKIISLSPSTNALSAGRYQDIVISFDTQMDIATLTTATQATHGNLSLYGSQTGYLSTRSTVFFSDNNRKVHIRPIAPLKPGERVDLTIRGAQSSTGSTMANSIVYQFHARPASGGSVSFASNAFGFGANNRNSVEVELGDLDGDGDVDAVIGNSGTHDEIWLNNGDGTFSASELILPGGNATRGMDIGDLDGDGDLDIMTSLFGRDNRMWFNRGDGTFVSSQFGRYNSENTGVSLGDIDGDGDLDAAMMSENLDYDDLFFNDGSGSMTNVMLGRTRNQRQTELADADNDGDLDFVAVGRLFQSHRAWNRGDGVFLFGNIGGPTFNNGGYWNIRRGDYNGDHVLERSFVNFPYGNADIDGDGDLDYISSEGGTRLNLNDGSGSFVTSIIAFSGFNDIAFGDLDGDGDLDAIAAVNGNNIVWLNQIAVTQLAITPAANANGAARDTDVSIDFSTAMSTSTLDPINSSVFLHGSLSGYVKQANVSFQDGDKTAVFNPDDDFLAGEIVQVISKGAESTGGTVAHNTIMSQFRAQAIGGTGDFTSQALGVGEHFISGDFDGNGRAEVLMVDDTETFSLKVNNDGTWTKTPLGIVPGVTAAGKAGDFDGDGDLDAVISRHNDTPLLLLNDGAGAFTTSTFGLAVNITNFEVGDIDADGDLDLLAGTVNDLSLFLNDGSAVFTHSTMASGRYADVKVGDFNNDDILDLIAVRRVFPSDQPAEIWLGNGDGTFNSLAFATGRFLDIAVGDLDNDGDLDVFAGTDQNYQSRLWFNRGNGSFTETLTGGTRNGTSVEIFDIDGDFDMDILLLATAAADQVMLNNGDATFRIETSSFLGVRDPAIGDLDGDGDLDFISGNGLDGTLFLNKDPLPFVQGISPSTHSNTAATTSNITLSYTDNTQIDQVLLTVGPEDDFSTTATFYDLTFYGSQSGHRSTTAGLTLVTAASQIILDPAEDFFPGERISISANGALNDINQEQLPQVFQFNVGAQRGSGGFYPLNEGGGNSSDVAIGDLDGDLDLDAIVTAQGETTAIWLNQGDGSFTISHFGSDSYNAVALGDFDGDRYLDVALANSGTAMAEIWMNNGDATFTAKAFGVGFGRSSSGVDIGDIDGDGDLDVLWAEGNSILIGRNANNRIPSVLPMMTGGAVDLALGDFNNDQALDILLTRGSNGIRLLVNNGDGSFAETTLATIEAGSLAVGDLNNDGNLDALIATSSSGNGIETWLGNGDGSFSSTSSVIAANVNGITLGDMNADGSLDALITTDNADEFWLNRGDGSFRKRVRGGGVSNGAAFGDFDKDGALEAIVARNGAERIWQNLDAPLISSMTPTSAIVTTASLNLSIDGHHVYATGADINVLQSNGSSSGTRALSVNSFSLTNASLTIPAGFGSTAGTTRVRLYTDAGQTNATFTWLNDIPKIATSQTAIISDEDVAVQVSFSLADVWPGLPHLIVTPPATDGSTIASISQAGATGATTRFLITPAQDAFFNNLPLTFSAWDGEYTVTTTINISFNPVNDPPLIAVTQAALTTSEDASTSLSMMVSDVDTPWSNLILSATSSNPALVTSGGISFGATGATTQVTIDPEADAFGQTLISLHVFDGEFTRTTSFTLDVTPVNDPPVLAVTTALVTSEEDASTTLSMMVSDVDTPFSNLILSATSSNLSLVENGGLSFGATGATTSLMIDPVTNANGSALISVAIHDGEFTRTTSFNVQFTAVNDAPVVRVTSAVQMTEDASTSLSMMVSDVDTPFSNLILSATSSNPALVTSGGISFGATGATTQVTIDPEADAFGQTLISLHVFDGEFTRTTSFTLDVTPVNDPPVLAVTTALVTSEEDASTTLSIQVSDVDTPFSNLILSATSSNLSLVENGGLSFGATGATTSLMIDPVTNANGSALISVAIHDGEFTRTTSFNVQFTAVNDAPVVRVTSAVYTSEDASTSLSIMVSDVDTPYSNLVLTALSDNPTLVTGGGLSFGATGATTSLMIDPAADANGSAGIRVTVDDGAATGSTTFTLTVNPVNDPPRISVVQSLITGNQNSRTTATVFLNDIDTPFHQLLVNGTSGNQTLLPDAGLGWSSTAATMQMILTPACGEAGAALVTASVSDGEFSHATSFQLQVLPITALSITGTSCACPDVAFSYSVEPADASASGHSWTVSGGTIIEGQGTDNVRVVWDRSSSATLGVVRTSLTGCSSGSVLNVKSDIIQAMMDFTHLDAPAAVTLAVLNNDRGSELSLAGVSDPAGGSARVEGNTVIYTPDSGFSGLDRFSYVVTNPAGCTVTGAIVAAVPENEYHRVNIEFVERVKNRVAGVRGLKQAVAVALSPDGRHVYAAGRGDHSIAIFDRDAISGELAYVNRVRNLAGGVQKLKYPYDLALSADGRHLYAAGYGANALVVFQRNAASGDLSFLQTIGQGMLDGGSLITNCSRPRALALSPDGRNIYAACFGSNTLVVFERSLVTGKLSWRGYLKDGIDGVDGLRGVVNLALSPDGGQVYAAGYNDNAIAVFERNLVNGALRYVECPKDGHDEVDGLAGASSVALSPDGAYLYASGQKDNAVAVFSRNAADGSLEFIERHKNGVDGVDGLAGVKDIAVSPDGRHVWTAGSLDDAVSVYDRAIDGGGLTWLQTIKDGVNGVDGLDQVLALSIAPTSSHAYGAAFRDHCVAVLFRNRMPRAEDDSPGIVGLNSSLLISPLANDSDPDGHSLIITSVTGASLGTTTISSGGTTIDYAAGGSPGNDSFSYTIEDGHGGSSTASVSLQVVLPKQAESSAFDLVVTDDAPTSLKLAVTPNPIQDVARISFALTRDTHLRIKVTDLGGRPIAVLSEGALRAGRHELSWNPRLVSGARPAAGSYLLVVEERGGNETLNHWTTPIVILP